MSQQIKLILGLCASLAVNVGLLIVIFKPTPTPPKDRALEHELVRKELEIKAYKQLIIERDVRLKESEVREDSLLNAVKARKDKIKIDNEAVYTIPDSQLNDTVKSILKDI